MATPSQDNKSEDKQSHIQAIDDTTLEIPRSYSPELSSIYRGLELILQEQRTELPSIFQYKALLNPIPRLHSFIKAVA